ncbi:hypothetical protein [Leptothermofonsia sp. ETS-13]|uniref:hypothetical protein n=1 Tax=Leptothermofonsia sp. ETS-13 TaxID=3035696 RepID=UPI003BA2B383
MNQPESQPPPKEPESHHAGHSSALKKFAASPIGFIMENPKLTPAILLTLAVAPILLLVLVLAIVLSEQSL